MVTRWCGARQHGDPRTTRGHGRDPYPIDPATLVHPGYVGRTEFQFSSLRLPRARCAAWGVWCGGLATGLSEPEGAEKAALEQAAVALERAPAGAG
jgi:hypothetical protein